MLDSYCVTSCKQRLVLKASLVVHVSTKYLHHKQDTRESQFLSRLWIQRLSSLEPVSVPFANFSLLLYLSIIWGKKNDLCHFQRHERTNNLVQQFISMRRFHFPQLQQSRHDILISICLCLNRPVGRGYRIHRLHLCWRIRLPLQTSVLDITLTRSGCTW